ncbi:DUF6702 family protein [Flavobacterium sp.]|uniref:DUF6702 family protein n=1 Tax=Flavobacterium sp. TaxID=239 RepID=UPI003A953EA1
MFLFMLAGLLTAAMAHKYYVAVFLVEHAPAKKQLQITARVFVDDLDAALSKKYDRELYLATKKEASGIDDYLAAYFSEKIKIKVNGSEKAISFLGHEIEDDVLIGYFTVEAKGKLKDLEIKNTLLFESFPDQQNIINTNINSNKKSLLLTNDSPTGNLQF